jgi:hypothetical protein
MALAIAAADGPLDGIVHAAGTQYRAPATAVPVAAWRDLMLDRVPTGDSATPPIWPARSYSCSPPRPATSPGNCCR